MSLGVIIILEIMRSYIKRNVRKRKMPSSDLARFPTPIGSFIMPTDYARSSQIYTLYLKNKIYEPETVSYLRSHVQPDDIMLDIGANFGYYSLIFSKLAYRGLVHAFEPNPECYEILFLNTSSISNIISHQLAVSNKIETRQFFKHRAYGMGGFIPQEGMNGIFQIETLPLDHFNFKRVDWIKIDVEGFESQVIEGLADTIKRNLNIRLIIEFKPERSKFGSEFWNILNGFEFHNLDSQNILAKRRIDEKEVC